MVKYVKQVKCGSKDTEYKGSSGETKGHYYIFLVSRTEKPNETNYSVSFTVTHFKRVHIH